MLRKINRNFMNYSLGALLCLIVLTVLSVSGFAQSKTLAAGNPPLTSQMVERYAGLMEWSLDVRFNAAERAALEKNLIAYWQAGDQKNVKAILDSLAFEQNLASASEAKKQEVQPQLKQQLFAAMRADAEDSVNKLLLEVYRRNQTADDPAAAGDGKATSDFSALVGKWRVLHGNSIVSVDVPSGKIGDGNSMIAEYDIRADGRVIFTFVLQQSNYGCTTRIKTSKTGRASVSGSRVTFVYDAGGSTTSEDNCTAKNNYTKKLAAEKEIFDFSIERKDDKPNFCFANARLKDCAIKIK